MVKLAAMDLDETLLDENSHLSAGTRDALTRAIARGLQIVPATGRAWDTIPEEVLTFPGFRWAITGNGAVIYDIQTGEAVRRQTLPVWAWRRVLRETEGWNVSFEVFYQGSAYAQEDYLGRLDRYLMDARRQVYVKRTRKPVPDIRAFLEEHGGELDSIAVIPGDLETRRRTLETLRSLPGIYVTTSHPRLVEVNHPDSTKAAGLKYMAERLGIPQGETAAFGNGDNDAEMLSWAGIGVSVLEGSERCRASADRICGSYKEDGVAKALLEMIGE